MRSIVWIAALGLVALPAMAGTGATGAGGNSAGANSAPATTAAAQPASAPAASSKAAPAAAAAAPSTENELQQLRELIEAQAKQLQEQNDQLREQQQQMQDLEDQVRASSASTTAENLAAAPVVGSPAPAIGVPAFGVGTTETPDPAGSRRSVSLNPGVGGYGGMDNPEEPTSIHYKGVTLTPGGFFAGETVWRQKALGADINTPFNNVPFDGASSSHLNEFYGSGRQSRISMLVEGKLNNVKIGGYYEMDFLGAGITSNNNQSNSYVMRQRQFWAQAAFQNGWTFTGGQMWSLLTETTHGMDNRTEALPMTIDAQYNVGFSWNRQYAFRVTKNFGNKIWLGFSVEDSQATLTVHGNPTVTSGGTEVPATTCTTVVAGACTAIAVSATSASVVNATTTNNFLLGQFGASGGLYNPAGNYAYNPSPDFIIKAVFEPGFGHYEIFGLASEERDRIFPCANGGGAVAPSGSGFPNTGVPAGCGGANVASAVGATNSTAGIGGGGANARWNFFAKKIDFGVHFFGGTGIGRYGSAGLADATVRPNGSIVPLHNYQSLATLQFHVGKKLDIYLNGGDEYEGRAVYPNTFPLTGADKPVGYGGLPVSFGGQPQVFANTGCWTEVQPIVAPSTSNSLGVPTGVGGSTGFIPGVLANCTGDTRNIIEGTAGFWYRFYSGPKGRVQFGLQYSNVYRETWEGTKTGSGFGASGQPHSDENMALSSFRYYLP
jgi:hypothetical protein